MDPPFKSFNEWPIHDGDSFIPSHDYPDNISGSPNRINRIRIQINDHPNNIRGLQDKVNGFQIHVNE